MQGRSAARPCRGTASSPSAYTTSTAGRLLRQFLRHLLQHPLAARSQQPVKVNQESCFFSATRRNNQEVRPKKKSERVVLENSAVCHWCVVYRQALKWQRPTVGACYSTGGVAHWLKGWFQIGNYQYLSKKCELQVLPSLLARLCPYNPSYFN